MFIVASENPRPLALNDSPGLSIKKTNCTIQWSRQLVSLVLIPLTVIYPGDTERYPMFQQPGPGRYVLALYPVYSQSGSGQIMRRLSFLH